MFFIFVCFVSSCNDDSSNTSTTSTTSTDLATATSASSNTTTASRNQTQALAGTLDILIADRATFTNLPNGTKIVFSHNFGANNKVHLKGWVAVGTTFPGTTVALTNGAPSDETFDASTFFSNVVLMPGEFKKIKDRLNGDPNYMYVLFLPKKVDTYFVGYDIYASIGSSFTSQALAADAVANPSPPRTQ